MKKKVVHYGQAPFRCSCGVRAKFGRATLNPSAVTCNNCLKLVKNNEYHEQYKTNRKAGIRQQILLNMARDIIEHEINLEEIRAAVELAQIKKVMTA